MIINWASRDPPVADDDQGWPPSFHGGAKELRWTPKTTWGAQIALTTPQPAPLEPKSGMIGDNLG